MSAVAKMSWDGATIDVDPFSIEVIENPLPFNEQLREAGPIFWLSRYGTYGVARYESVAAVLKDNKQFTSGGGSGLSDIRKPGAWRQTSPIVEADPPVHTQVRVAMNQILSPRVIRGWKESFTLEAEKLCDDLFANHREFDAVPELAERYIFKVFPDALGVNGDREKLLAVGEHSFNGIGPQNELFLKSRAGQEAVTAWFEHNQTREAMVPGGFGEQIFAAEDQGALMPGTASPLIRTLLRGGSDTTISAIGTTLKLLAEQPDQWDKAKANPGLMRFAFEEAVRLETPSRTFFRTTATEECQFAGHRLSPDTKVQIFAGAANRDPRMWDRPDSFDLTRKPLGHIGFGLGIHNCIGQMIARMEMECLIGSFMRRVSSCELTGAPRFRPNNALRTLATLPLRVTLA